jgi:hypothetical protein
MKTVRMISPGNVTEVNFSAYGLFHPMDDGSFAIPEAMVGEAMKANLTVRELTNAEKLARIMDIAADLDEPNRIAIVAAISARQLTVGSAPLRPDLAP